MEPVPESVKRSTVTSWDLRPNTFQCSLSRKLLLSSGVVIGRDSTDLILKGSMIVLNSIEEL